MRVGLLTGGGDAPGLNGVLEAAGGVLLQQKCEVVGIRDGFEGIFKCNSVVLTKKDLIGLHACAGTILGTSNRSGTKGREAEFLAGFEKLKIDGLIAIGGDGTFRGLELFKDKIKLIGVPKTIDNDLPATEITFGFDTACAMVAESADSLRATGDAHGRIMVVETMGRNTGWIALGGGLAAQADVILIPERPFNREMLIKHVMHQKHQGRRSLTIVASEGASAVGENASVAFEVKGSPQAERYGGFAERLTRWLEKETGWEARHVSLGHLQRARPPTTTDRFLTLAMGVEAARLALNGEWGKAVVYRHGRIETTAVTDIMNGPRLVEHDHRWIGLAQALGIFI